MKANGIKKPSDIMAKMRNPEIQPFHNVAMSWPGDSISGCIPQYCFDKNVRA